MILKMSTRSKLFKSEVTTYLPYFKKKVLETIYFGNQCKVII